MNKHRPFRKRLSDYHLEEERDVKRPKRSRHDIDTTKLQQSRYQYCSILPDVKELHITDKISPHVKPNIAKGKYDGWQHYLSTQFNLLREDFVAPLRRAVLEYENGDSTSCTSVYQEAKFTGMVVDENGVLLTVKFDTTISKSFKNGTLLCFSSDNFNTILFATVVSHREENQTEEFSDQHVDQIIQVKVNVESDRDNLGILGINACGCISNSQTYAVIESPAHYETYYHVLKCLQKVNPHEMPFTDYLIAYKHEMRCPSYLARNAYFDMAEVLKLSGNNSRPCFNIINKDCWPSHNIKGLDESQVEALKLAFTHEVALIQGPPGTGKTYIGGKIMEALLTNKAEWDPDGNSPILVVSYTNQALDQFFEKIIDIKSKLNNRLYYHGGLQKELKCNPREIVRIGGGCNEAVSCYSLKNLKSVDWKRGLNKKGKLIFVTNDKHNNFLCAQKSKFEKMNKKINHKIALYFNSSPTVEDLSEFIDPVHLGQLKCMHKSPDKCIGVWLQGKDYKMTRLALSRRSTGNHPSSKNAFMRSNYHNMCHTKESQQLVSYTKAEAQSIANINSLSIGERIKLFNLWIKQFRHHQYNEICTLIEDFNKIHKIFIDSRDRKHFEMLQKAHVICMTTTGAAKHKHLLEKLKPKIVIAEEAAEVLESHIIACLTTATKHLILIGDDQQLRPNPSEHLLDNNYYKFGISLFERLRNNGVPCASLLTQHRMRPEIADLVRRHVYDNELKDHPSVKEYDDIKGITTNMYFFDHIYPEKMDENNKSYYNEEEGNFVIKLCRYLLKHYKYNKITVVTAYTSQVRLLKERIKGEKRNFSTGTLEMGCNENHVEVKTIDNYQGEENNIIILSLVRSNEDNNIGFLMSKNRTCVALSRAKEGLYCFGNFTALAKKSTLWKNIVTDLQKKKKIGSVLQLCCVNHQLSITNITKPKDFEKVPEGGCWRRCNKYLDCRHRCMLKCHITDQDHKDYQCKKTCLNKCENCGGPCKHKCYIPCSSQQCKALVEKVIPKCNRGQLVPCYMEPGQFECNKTQFGAVLSSEKCNMKVTKYFQICKHVTELPCCDSHLTECPVKCNTVLLCGHRCSGTCHECHQGRLHKPCMFHVSKLLCGHETTMKCSSAMVEPYPSCSHRCESFCPHKKCSHKCQDPCKPCNNPCDWQCPHYKCTRKCHEKCNRPRCYEPCQRLNKCHHPCIGVCGERCPDVCKFCDEEQFLQLYVSLNQFKTKEDTTYIQLDCGHLFKRTELDPWVDARSKEFQLISCPKCNQPIHLNQRRYANAIRRTYDDITEIRHMMSEDVETNVKIEALKRYHMTITDVMKVLDLTNLKTLFLGLSYEELQQFQIPAVSSNNIKFNQEVQKFIENKNNWLSAINVIINLFNSILSLLKSSRGNSDIKKSLQVLLEFTATNHTSLSLQVIQDVTREQKRLALWTMANQLKREIPDPPDLQIVKQVENVLVPIEPGRFKPLLPQLTKHLYSILSKLADKYGTALVDEEYISTPKLPLLYTGRWTQCSEGHYYCIPQQLPEVPCDFSTSQCPCCTEYDDDNEDMDVVNASR